MRQRAAGALELIQSGRDAGHVGRVGVDEVPWDGVRATREGRSFLPVATGTAVFLLLNDKAEPVGRTGELANQNQAPIGADDALLAIGLFGLAFTMGLFAYELYGIKKCHYLIAGGARLEREMEVPGQFQSRPRELAGFINEPFASAVIYPASLAAWLYLALALKLGGWAVAAAIAVFVVGLIGTPLAVRRVKINQEREDL